MQHKSAKAAQLSESYSFQRKHFKLAESSKKELEFSESKRTRRHMPTKTAPSKQRPKASTSQRKQFNSGKAFRVRESIFKSAKAIQVCEMQLKSTKCSSSQRNAAQVFKGGTSRLRQFNASTSKQRQPQRQRNSAQTLRKQLNASEMQHQVSESNSIQWKQLQGGTSTCACACACWPR
jgi:hypothetical protein